MGQLLLSKAKVSRIFQVFSQNLITQTLTRVIDYNPSFLTRRKFPFSPLGVQFFPRAQTYRGQTDEVRHLRYKEDPHKLNLASLA